MSSSVKQDCSVKDRFVRDMQMAGLTPQTQQVYLGVVKRFVKVTRTRPQDATEAQVADYLRQQVQRGLCQGTIRPLRYALQFIFQNTLGRPWDLFKKESPPVAANACPRPPVTSRPAASSPPSAPRLTGFAWP